MLPISTMLISQRRTMTLMWNVTTYTLPPPIVGNDIIQAISIALAYLFQLAIMGIICCCCARRIRKIIVRDLQTVSVAAAATALRAQHHVHVPTWEIDASTMEMFLRDIEREKTVRFTAQQLCSFTSNYAIKLGSGGFGVVYQGQFPNGVKIAVKVLNRTSEKITAEEQFMAEVRTIGKTYHMNLVRLYGFCHDQYMSALVYEYMENGSLDKYLFSDHDQEKRIEWEKLHQIAIGIAKALAYLHEECQQRIIHYDIKPGNVLLDANLFPKLADFGLAGLCNKDNTHVTESRYKGTPGYSAPEFLLKNYPITHKCDVYSFGMVLFEIVGRRKNTIVSSSDSLDWFPKHVLEEYEKGELAALVTACGIEEKDKNDAERMCKVALWCVQDSPTARPPMCAVVKMLEGELEIKAPPKPFHYLQSIGMTAPRPLSSGTGSSSGEEGTSYSYRETTRIMAKYDNVIYK